MTTGTIRAAIDNLLTDVAVRDPGQAAARITNFLSEQGGAAMIDVVNATSAFSTGANWLATFQHAIKSSMVGDFNQANWQTVLTPSDKYANAFSKIDGFKPETILLQTGGSAVSASSGKNLVLGSGGGRELN